MEEGWGLLGNRGGEGGSVRPQRRRHCSKIIIPLVFEAGETFHGNRSIAFLEENVSRDDEEKEDLI